MAKRESGNVVVASDWTPIPLLDPGMYDAVIQDAKLETFKGTFRNFGTKTEVPNPKDKEGKWDYDKLVMNIDVHDQRKVVSLPGYSETIGIWHEGDYYSPIDKSTMYGRAAKLLRATGQLTHTGVLKLDDGDLQNKGLLIETAIRGYVKNKQNYNVKTLSELLNGPTTKADYELEAAYANVQEGAMVFKYNGRVQRTRDIDEVREFVAHVDAEHEGWELVELSADNMLRLVLTILDYKPPRADFKPADVPF